MSDIDRAALERFFTAAPFIRELGLELVSITPGECRSRLEIAARHLQQDGFVHAGVQGAMADHTAGAAAASLLRPGQHILGAEYKINLLRAARGESMYCVARVIKAGRTLTVAEAENWCVAGGEEKLVSKALVTLAVVGETLTGGRS
ncbi:PaaI family thioesterase [Thioalkalivibrio sp. XN279]|uniref:PaaI family thioesterase n=1 Tax=Thioalkalivibrio sp. XN279 TaxID=2714953 RepID=UPI00140C2B60|nr:PaaI family thioesterase [Thioalkalivibrio sp. XN279]NHA15109.1 PaaI family thioesterase [Thioalkalivibrio sp. XN279]